MPEVSDLPDQGRKRTRRDGGKGDVVPDCFPLRAEHGMEFMIIGYARVSTDEQSLSLQIQALERTGCERIFKDKGISGRAFKRPGLGSCLRTLAEGDILVVWRLDRLGRSLAHLIDTMGQLEDRKIHLRSLT